MANIGQSTPSTRSRNLPQDVDEKRELRRMVQELQDELAEAESRAERYGKALCQIINRSAYTNPARIARHALDGGGGDHE